jgi:hypothetical protein
MTIVHLEWQGPYGLNDLKQLCNPEADYGVYQIYGKHALYGPHSLLYVGKAECQTFGVRIAQEGWWDNRDAGNVQIYVGRLGGVQQPTPEGFAQLVDQVESLLIYAHGPACNAAKLKSLSAQLPASLRVLNWGCFRDLMPEVSAERWNGQHWNLPGYALYCRPDNPQLETL